MSIQSSDEDNLRNVREISSQDLSVKSQPELVRRHSLDDLNDQQLINVVQEKEAELRHLRLENIIFIRFLQANDPSELDNYDSLVEFALKKFIERKSCPIPKFGASSVDVPRASFASSRRSMRESMSSLSSLFDGRGPKVNLSQKSDMVLKIMEEIQSSLEIFLRKTKRVRRNLKAELEEFSIREKDIKESIESFEFNILVQGVDRLTQRIPAERFLRWMEEWLKSAQLNVEKLRLRTASLKIQYKKVSATLLQRQELGENVHAVDFDQLEIENKHFSEKIDMKTIQLIELKKMSGGASLVLTKNKKDLRGQQDEYNGMKAEVAEKEKIISAIELECDKIEEELEKAKDNYDSFKKLTVTYKVPDVMEYVNIKNQLNDISNQLKVWNRRKKIQDITINVCLRQMKNITGTSKINRAWLEDLNAEGSVHSTSFSDY